VPDHNSSTQPHRSDALILEQEAAVDAARARLDFARINKKRYENLAATGAGTAQQHQEADSTLAQDDASLQGTIGALEAARRQMDILRAQVLSAQATVASDNARLEQAMQDARALRAKIQLDEAQCQATPAPDASARRWRTRLKRQAEERRAREPQQKRQRNETYAEGK
jgi:hypothetical protein